MSGLRSKKKVPKTDPASPSETGSTKSAPGGNGDGGEGSGQDKRPGSMEGPGDVEPADRLKFIQGLSNMKEYSEFVAAISAIVSGLNGQ